MGNLFGVFLKLRHAALSLSYTHSMPLELFIKLTCICLGQDLPGIPLSSPLLLQFTQFTHCPIFSCFSLSTAAPSNRYQLCSLDNLFIFFYCCHVLFVRHPPVPSPPHSGPYLATFEEKKVKCSGGREQAWKTLGCLRSDLH